MSRNVGLTTCKKKRDVVLYEANIQVMTVGFSDWVVKADDGHYSHRPEGEYGVWRPGIPPDALKADVDWAFGN